MERIRKAIGVAAAISIASASFASAEDSFAGADAIAAAHELIVAQDQGGHMKQVSEALGKMIQEQLSATDPAAGKFAGNFLRTALSPDSPAMKKFIADVQALQVAAFANELSADEMKQLATFLQSDAYKKLSAANLKILASAAPVVTQFQKSLQIEAYGELTKEQPKNAAAWNGLCWITITAGGEPDKALGYCNNALQLNPRFAHALDSRGLVYLKLGDFDRAAADYDAALRICPRMAGAAYGRGIAKIKRGDFAGGSEDIVMAKTANANLVAQFASYGVK